MLFRGLLLAVLLLGGMCGVARGQVVQLPTTHSFSVGTTVSVPDGGAVQLGGVSRSYESSSDFGIPGLGGLPVAGRLFRNRGISRGVERSGAWATATIHDLRAMDEATLQLAARQRAGRAVDPTIERRAAFLTQHIGRSAGSAASGSRR